MTRSKLIRTLILASLALLAAGTEIAAEPPGDPEARMLMHLLEMEDSELASVRETIERIEAMSPEERSAMRERLGKFQQMHPERREIIRQRIRAIPKEQREAMRRRWFEMSAEEKAQWRKKLRGMSPAERAKVIEEEGFLPPHPKSPPGVRNPADYGKDGSPPPPN